ncbi:MAG: beta-N-acetylhexosaminidase [Acidobacteria bacterium]|nr:beta-N-acetylhexosaminidase [Acidobacteriota bacterium]
MWKALPVCFLTAAVAWSQPPATPLWLRGYSVIPTPQKVELEPGDVEFNGSWGYRADGVAANHIAVRSLLKDLREFHSIDLRPAGATNIIRLSVRKGTVATPGDPEIHPQGYRLKIAPSLVEITGNGDAGLFYGVQTLVQLLKPGPRGGLLLPGATIDDWPALQLRFLHWDTKHHQDRMETLKRYLDWAARFKVNMIGFELEDKFEYPSNPVIGAPGAFTVAQLQEIVNYGLERFIQVVANIQAPAHLAYVLKHPQFAHLRADGNNYQACLCDEESYKLIFQMYDDVIQATRGVDYFFVSTDEIYYAGIGARCDQPDNPANRSLKWAEFARRAHDHLARRGRRMLARLEYPLLPEHLKLIPSGVIDGVIGEPEYIPIEKQKGMRQLAYVSMQGAEFLFPDHLGLESELRDPPAPGADDPLEFERGLATGRIQAAFEQISFGRVWQANPIGVFGAAWGDSGLHNETFWLGWSAVAQYGWTTGTPSPEQHVAEFMNVYYGPRATGMAEIYRSLQRQARAWQRAWERVVSRVRGPGYGNSDGKGIGATRYDQTLTPPAIPQMTDLKFQPRFIAAYRRFLAQAPSRSLENDQLLHALQANFARVDRNQYNLEVLAQLTRFIGHHWRLLLGLADAESSLERAQAAAQKNDAEQAVGHLVAAYNTAGRLEKEGRESFRQLAAVFEKSQYPKGRPAGGKRFVHVVDDTKDHWADRRPDWSYMFAPEESIGLDGWRKQLRQVIEAYAKARHVAVRGLSEARLEE